MSKCVAARGENLQSDLGVKGLSPSQTMDFTYMFVTGPVTLSCHFEETLFKQLTVTVISKKSFFQLCCCLCMFCSSLGGIQCSTYLRVLALWYSDNHCKSPGLAWRRNNWRLSCLLSWKSPRWEWQNVTDQAEDAMHMFHISC